MSKVFKELFKIIGTAGDSVRFASKPGFIDDLAKRFGDIKDAKAAFVRDKVILAIKNGDDPTSIVTKLGKGEIAAPENLRHFIKTKYPLNDYSKWIDDTNTLARKLGFEDETHFEKYISNLNLKKDIQVTDTQKLAGIFRYIKSYVTKHPTSVAKAAIAGGTLALMVSYLKKFQAENTGCFRYGKDDDNNLIRYKFEGNFCLDSAGCGGDVKMLSENQHPLFNLANKWDCGYSQFEMGNPVVDEILDAGCNGLCDWLNFNTLTGLTTGDDQFNPYEDENHDHRYIYKCEKATILRAIASGVSNVIDETLTGFAQSDLGKKTIKFLKSQFGQFIAFVFIMVLIYLSIGALSKHWMAHHQTGE